MEITAEVTKDEYQSFIKKYYLKRNWTKRIGILAIIAIGLSVLNLLSLKSTGNYLLPYFIFFSTILIVVFFIIPYSVLYVQMSASLKRVGESPVLWLIRISDTGVQINIGKYNKFLPWRNLNKVIAMDNFVVFKTTGSQVYFLPLSAFADSNASDLLELIRIYRKEKTNRPPNPNLLYVFGVICLIPFLGCILGFVYIILGFGRYKNSVLVGIGAIGLLVTGYVLRDIILSSKQSDAYEKIDPQIVSQITPKDYQLLFGNRVLFTSSFNSKLRAPISKFNYKQFHGLVYKIDSANNLKTPLGNIIKETNFDTHITYHQSYREVSDYGSLPEIFLIMDRPAKPKYIYINLCGDSTRDVLKNDSIAYYYSNFKNFFIQYTPAGKQEFFSKASGSDDNNESRLKIEIMFLKRKSDLFLILLVANNSKTKLPVNTLYDLIEK